MSSQSKIQLNQPAPDFTLQNTKKEKFTLSEQKGKNVLLLFFPLAFTSVCTSELCSVNEQWKWYETADADVYGISVDSIFCLAKFKETYQLNFELLSDFNKEVSTLYGVLYEEFFGLKGVSKRAAFLIDKEGVIRYIEILEDASKLPDFKQIEQVLQNLKNTN
ncbi:MAG: redoxin domain-containing protein [Chitinophagaceae bacterium]|nr:redoxin domain-containing protein [Chitinophagaceae bacterium]